MKYGDRREVVLTFRIVDRPPPPGLLILRALPTQWEWCRQRSLKVGHSPVNTLVDRHTGRSKKMLSPEDLFASFSYQAGEVVLYVVDEVICKDVESTLG